MLVNVTMEQEIDLDMEAAGNVVANVLMEDFEYISKDINTWMRQLGSPNCPPYVAQDLADSIEMRNAMQTLLRYYLNMDDYRDFMETQRVYGNVQ